MKKCPICGAEAIKAVREKLKTPGGVMLTAVARERCGKCGEEFFTGSAVERIQQAEHRRKAARKNRAA